MRPEPAEIEGIVEEERVAPGSKSDRMAVVLKAASGVTYLLELRGAPSFGPLPELLRLVGRRIRAEGFVSDRTFYMDRWTPLD